MFGAVVEVESEDVDMKNVGEDCSVYNFNPVFN